MRQPPPAYLHRCKSHVDDSLELEEDARQHGFAVVRIAPDDPEWTSAVIDAVDKSYEEERLIHICLVRHFTSSTMAIPQKGSRKVMVDGVPYRWRIRRKPTYSEGAFASPFSVAVERIAPASRCVLLLEVAFPRPDNWLGHESHSVTPRAVAASIKEALGRGWQPEQEGSRFTQPLRVEQNASSCRGAGI